MLSRRARLLPRGRRLRLAVLVGVCLAVTAVALPRPVEAQHEAAALLARWVEAAPTSFDFVQEKHLSVLSRPIVSHGVITRRADQTLLWHQTDPIDATIVIGPAGIESGAGNADTTLQGAIASIAGAVVDIFFGRVDHLATLFDATVSDSRLVLTPKDDLLSRVMARIELDGASGLSKITLIEKSGDFTTIGLAPASAASAPK